MQNIGTYALITELMRRLEAARKNSNYSTNFYVALDFALFALNKIKSFY